MDQEITVSFTIPMSRVWRDKRVACFMANEGLEELLGKLMDKPLAYDYVVLRLSAIVAEE